MKNFNFSLTCPRAPYPLEIFAYPRGVHYCSLSTLFLSLFYSCLPMLLQFGFSSDPLKCPVCGISFTRDDNLQKHKKVKHKIVEENNSLSCLKCNRQFRFSADFKQHKISHDVESLPGFDQLKSVLPADGYSYEYLSLSLQQTGFLAKFEIPDFEANQITDWLNQFQNKNYVTFRVVKLRKTKFESSNCVLNNAYRCHHNTRRKTSAVKSKRLTKNTDCPAILRLMLRRAKSRMTTKLIVRLQHTHNHPLNAASALRFRDPSSDVREKFIEMFRSGHSVCESLEMHRQHLKLEYGDDYSLIAVDRDRKHATFMWVYTLYYEFIQRGCRVSKDSAVKECSSDSTKPPVLTSQQRCEVVVEQQENIPPDWFTTLDVPEPQETAIEEECVVVWDENEDDMTINLDGSLVCTSASNETPRPPSSVGSSEVHASPLTIKLKSILGRLFDAVEAKPELFSGAVAAAEESLSRVQTEEGLVSVLYNIGKLTGSRKTPIARRKTSCEGQRPVRSGRVVKKSQKDHDYSQ